MSEIHDLYLTTEALLKKHVPHTLKIEKAPGCYRDLNFNPELGLRLTEGICGNTIEDSCEKMLLDHVAMLEELQFRASPYLPLGVDEDDEPEAVAPAPKPVTAKKTAAKKK